MVEDAINKAYLNIVRLIEYRKLKDAIKQMTSLLEQCPDWNLQTNLEQVSTSYTFMLQYMLQGTSDPERKKLYDDIVIHLLEIADRLHLLLLDNVSSKLFHILRNRENKNTLPNDLLKTIKQIESVSLDLSVNSLLPDNNKQEETVQQLYRYEKELFLQTWINATWSQEDEDAANYLLQAPAISSTDLCMFIGAVTMSLMQCFDLKKLNWLFNVYMLQKSAVVTQRAIIGIFLTLHLHTKRLKYYPIISKRLSLLKDQPSFTNDLTQCYINFIYCRETGKITKIMNDEIVPGIIKDMNNMKSPIEHDDDEENSMNPKWLFPNIENKELENKLERLTRMSMEGGDLYMSTFQGLKNFAFFHDIENWFKPFDVNQPIVMRMIDQSDKALSTIFKFVKGASYLCDNDKYSIVHVLPRMPLPQFDMMKDQLQQAEEAMKEEEDKNELLSKDDKLEKQENGNYMHDLYRFFKLSPRKNEFNDIFNEEINLTENKDITDLLIETGNLMVLAEFLLKKKYWNEAGMLYDILINYNQKNINDGNLYSRRGYIFQKMKLYQEALQCYLKAEIFMPDDNWLKEQIATCYRCNRQYKEALSYYQRLEPSNDENTTLLFYIGYCLAEMQQYEDAFKYFFKVNFLQPDNLKALRAIAWYSFICDKTEQAVKYYQIIIGMTPIATDYLNMGHILWIERKIKKAVDYYRSALNLCKDKDEFLTLFRSDATVIIKKGIDADSIPLMLDLI
jgi:tetratricopeptide (TPR) repeat protein